MSPFEPVVGALLLALEAAGVRPDEAGVKFVADRAAAITEGQHLETLGYVVTGIAESPHAVAHSTPVTA